MISKNAKVGRGKGVDKRMLNGEVVQATLYVDYYNGNGKYMTGMVNDKLVCDKNGKPLPLRAIGQMEIAQ